MTPAERKAKNEATFREANESMSATARDIVGGDETALVPFVCECHRPSCTEIVLLTLAEYEDARSSPRSGLARPGHEDRSIENVIDRHQRYLVTEKFGEAGEVIEEA